MRNRRRHGAADAVLAGRGWSRQVVLAALLAGWTAVAGCGRGPNPEAGPANEPMAQTAPDGDGSPDPQTHRSVPTEVAADHAVAEADTPPIDIAATAEEVLAGMSSEWRVLLAEAEAHQAGDMGQGCAGCHVDVSDQWVGTRHDQADIGCIKCHGSSEGHVQDENSEVLPDEIFAPADMDRLCAACHRCEHAAAARNLPNLLITGTPPVCTDCHPAHAFPVPR